MLFVRMLDQKEATGQGTLKLDSPALRFCLKAYFKSLCTLNREPGGFVFLFYAIKLEKCEDEII